MRGILKGLSIFDWMTPGPGFIKDVATPRRMLVMNEKNHDRAISRLNGIDFYSYHHLGNTYVIMIAEDDLSSATIKLSGLEYELK